jgi:adenylylsulfate kinase-like enzyme
LFCGATADKPLEDLGPGWVQKNKASTNINRRFRCPMESCKHWAPKQFKEKTYAGLFRIVHGGEAIFEGPSCDEINGEERMTNEEQIEAIKRIITETFKKN